MKLRARTESQDSEATVTLEFINGRVCAEVDGHKYDLEITFPEPDAYLLTHNGSICEAIVSKQGRSGRYKVSIRGKEYEIEIIDPRRLRADTGQQSRATGTIELRAMMPGKVVRVLVEEGSDIKKGEGVLVVEAMKMQNELRSTRDGRVVRIAVDEGATVAAGDLLAVIE
ncbi:MAG: hypothetical protein C4325_02485 [Blastocatellia bacterium]